jgi:hypothetical protein
VVGHPRRLLLPHDLEALRYGAFAEFRGKPAIVAEAGSNARLSNAQSDRLTERVRRSLQTITDLSQFTRRDFDSLLLHVRTRLRGDGRVDKAVQLPPHVLDDMGQLGHLGCDQLYVRVLGHASFADSTAGERPCGSGPRSHRDDFRARRSCSTERLGGFYDVMPLRRHTPFDVDE